jgi:N-acetylglucosaminyldiphosphoundecaprenol N-acetyl-beta-D-mannosaminyltransferase
LTLGGAVQVVRDMIAAGEKCSVVTPNLQHLREAQRHADLRAALLAADLVVADGAPIVWLSRLAGRRLPARVTGIDLFSMLCQDGAVRPFSVFLLGGKESSSAATGAILSQQGVTIVGRYTGPVDLASPPTQLIEELWCARPDVVAVFLGVPKQEVFVHQCWELLPKAVYMSLGGTVDFIAGKQPRAPAVWQRLGLEWIFRLLHDPRRLFFRYLLGGFFFLRTALAMLRARWTQKLVRTDTR